MFAAVRILLAKTKLFQSLLFLSSLLLATPQLQAAEEVSCDCPKLECDTCHDERGVTFYSEKCGPKNVKVKSCARPTCVPVDPLPKDCSYVKNGGTDGVVVAGTQKPAPPPKPLDEKSDVKVNLVPAPAKAVEERGPEVATVKAVKGDGWLKSPDGKNVPLTEKLRIHEHDTVETDKDAEVVIEFDDGNMSSLQGNSSVKISQYDKGEKKDRKAILDLIQGKMRNKVKQKYDGNTSYFRVKTRAAVAGVRGTDFVVSYEMREGKRIETKVETVEGRVMLAGGDGEDENSETQKVEIGAGESSSFLIAANEGEVFDEDEISDFVSRGYMTPVYKMTAADLKRLEGETGFGRIAKSGAVKKSICANPKAEYNQCLWVCVNNPKGEAKCRTDMPQVNCVRKRCDAEGEWSDENRLPASFHDRCLPEGYKVGPCDY